MVVFGKVIYILKEEMLLHLPILKTQFPFFFEKLSFLREGNPLTGIFTIYNQTQKAEENIYAMQQ
jgi:hypothetical protein